MTIGRFFRKKPEKPRKESVPHFRPDPCHGEKNRASIPHRLVTDLIPRLRASLRLRILSAVNSFLPWPANAAP
jgi:hypothetical protein